jgi:hypothetical protein
MYFVDLWPGAQGLGSSQLSTDPTPPAHMRDPRLSTDRNRRPSINRGSGSAELNWRVEAGHEAGARALEV